MVRVASQLFEKAGVITRTTGPGALKELLEAKRIQRIGKGSMRESYSLWMEHAIEATLSPSLCGIPGCKGHEDLGGFAVLDGTNFRFFQRTKTLGLKAHGVDQGSAFY